MSRLSEDNVRLAAEIIGRYPRPKSALVPLLHLAQEQDGWVTRDAMRAELKGDMTAILGYAFQLNGDDDDDKPAAAPARTAAATAAAGK